MGLAKTPKNQLKLSRFAGRTQLLQAKDKRKAKSDFEGAIKATAAFATLWRAVYGGAKGIDNEFRRFMKTGEPKLVSPLNWSCKRNSIVTLGDYKELIRNRLAAKGIGTKHSWVAKVAVSDIYENAKTICRFLLFLAMDDAVVDESKPGLWQNGRSGIQSICTYQNWVSKDYETIEHIAPQAASVGWKKQIYNPQNCVHRLGNLIILPAKENSEVLSNKSWEQKKAIFEIFASDTQEKFDTLLKRLLEGLPVKGQSLSKNAYTILQMSRCSVMSKSISLIKDGEPWTKELIESRSKLTAELAWDKLNSWIKCD